MTFDYTNRDYTSISEDLLARAAQVFPEWTSRQPSDFGVLLVELWAYMGDSMHFYIDRAARESFLNTASKRSSVLAIANLFDYIPEQRQPAVAYITLDASQTSATDNAPIYLPKNTRFLATPLVDTASKVVFTLDNPIAFVGTSVAASSPVVSDGVTYNAYVKTQPLLVRVTEGEVFEETYTSTGAISQRFKLKRTGIVPSSIEVSVSEGPNQAALSYSLVDRLVTSVSSDRVFTVEVDANVETTLVFGNGVNGKIPTTNSTVSITYRRSRGSAGNVSAGAINALETTTVLNKPSLNGLVVIPNTSKAFGGLDYESIESIRSNIPRAFRTQDRAVSLQDYKDLVLRVPGIVRSTAYVDGSDVVQILAVQTPSSYGSSNVLVLSEDKVDDIEAYLAPRQITFVTSNVGASVTLTPVNITAAVHVKDGYVREAVGDAVDSAVKEIFSFDNMDFGASVSLGTLYRTILNVEGVEYASVSRFTTTGSNVIDQVGNFVGVGVPSTSMLVVSITSSFTITKTGGIVALG